MAEANRSKQEVDPNLKYLVRVANTDLEGGKMVLYGLRKIKGINTMFANAVCVVAGVDPCKKSGYLTDEEVSRLNQAIASPLAKGIPVWMVNRRKDPETGEDLHTITGDLQFCRENDIKMMKKMKCYKGVRHSFGLPVRGQSTKSKHRKTKSRGKGGLGVRVGAAAKSQKK